MMNINMIEEAIRNILIAIGEDPEREGLKDTPKRVAKMYEEVFEGIQFTNDEIASMYSKSFECATNSHDIVLIKDIPIYSYCEHHMALMYNMYVSVVYKPIDKVLGLSKVYRIVDMVGKRLQLQERIGLDIINIINKVTGSEDIMVVVEAVHSCVTTRGIKNSGGKTKTINTSGCFNNESKKMNALQLLIDSK